MRRRSRRTNPDRASWMKVVVKLYGTLGQQFPGYQPSQGIEVDLPEGATVRDLLAHLRLPERAIVIVEGRVLPADAGLQGDAPVSVFQPIGGG